MKQNAQSMECAGSLTPELEGSQRTRPHPVRFPPAGKAPQSKKGGSKHDE